MECGDQNNNFENLVFNYSKNLKNNDIFIRLNVLKELENVILKHNSSFSENEFQNAIEPLCKILLNLLTDKSEKCREISVKVLNNLFISAPNLETLLPPTIAILVSRLGKSDEREPSEEIRLLAVQLLFTSIECYDGDLVKHLTDISYILSNCIIDECPEVKRKSCECISLLALKEKDNFHMISETFIAPLLKTIIHQHSKTRTLCVKAIGSVICYGNNKNFNDVVPHLTQRLFDDSPTVRLTVTEVIGKWLISLADRYSYFHRLIPMMLSTLYDEVEEINNKAKLLWNKAGEQYLEENERDYKDLIDFPKPDPEGYPEKGQRPSLGCRILVQRHLYNIIAPLLNDLKDWIPETRLKSAKVLYSLVLHSENKATIKLQSFVEGIASIAKDENKEVVEQAIKSAEILGFFIEPNLLFDNLISLIHKSPSAANLSILAAAIRGSHKKLSKDCFTVICKYLADPNIIHSRKAEEQASLLVSIEALFMSDIKIDLTSSYQIFFILTSIASLTSNNSINLKAINLIQYLANSQSISIKELYGKHMLPLLKEITAHNEIWTFQSPEMPIFYFLVASEYINEEIIDFIIPVLINNLQLKKDPKMRSHFLSLINKIFEKSIIQNEIVLEKILKLIREGIFINLTWIPGKTASALRTIAAANLYEIINTNFTKFMIKSISNEILPILTTLSEDDAVPTRILSCKILELILPVLIQCVEEQQIHSLCHNFLHCLDDESDDIRMMVLKVYKTYFISFSQEYNWTVYSSYLQTLYKNILVHMDDKNEKIRITVLELLKIASHAQPHLLLKEVEEKKYMMIASDLCNELIDYIKSSNV